MVHTDTLVIKTLIKTSLKKKIFYSYHILYDMDNPNQVLSKLTVQEADLLFNFVRMTMKTVDPQYLEDYQKINKDEIKKLSEKLEKIFSDLEIDINQYQELIDACNYILRPDKYYENLGVQWTKDEEKLLKKFSTELLRYFISDSVDRPLSVFRKYFDSVKKYKNEIVGLAEKARKVQEKPLKS